ncbi:FAS1-like dehydratase domain-containing protein [Micromonospora cremea]|uniref:3-methylfumaryl-CoA hydratase n=1 Tax=Micromonospora cremea TaxID=709881 RepID=A0A1N5TEY0_9ACTN|nr:MaoC family dehydratase N-terminal domain-containing protein [Micromonospora cremea]SIM46639.1 3-methylfumaryl-CoA hydratase [Micromonospora cremea]
MSGGHTPTPEAVEEPDRSWLEEPSVVHGAWQASVERAEDVLSPTAVTNLHHLLDRAGDPPQAIPVMWHLVAFTPRCPQAELSPDGHPWTGSFLPPMAARQRMFAGSRVRRQGVLRSGDVLEQVSRVTSVDVKHGRAGELVFVGVRHLLTGPSGWICQDDTIVYREPAPLRTPPPADEPGPWTMTKVVDPVLLFRYSAITYNAHRIHYDRSYACDVEGYPGLVVHGPLQATLLADLAGRHVPEHLIADFSFRATAPAFDTADFEMTGRPIAGGVELTGRSGGAVTMRATARLKEDT